MSPLPSRLRLIHSGCISRRPSGTQRRQLHATLAARSPEAMPETETNAVRMLDRLSSALQRKTAASPKAHKLDRLRSKVGQIKSNGIRLFATDKYIVSATRASGPIDCRLKQMLPAPRAAAGPCTCPKRNRLKIRMYRPTCRSKVIRSCWKSILEPSRPSGSAA